MAKKENRINIQLECQTCRKSGSPGVSRYATTKNKKTTTARIEMKKYCRYERKHTVHKEVK
jgi:large subunit ribosomal protein L33